MLLGSGQFTQIMPLASLDDLMEWMETNLDTDDGGQELQSLLSWYRDERREAAAEVQAALEVDHEQKNIFPGVFFRVEVCMDTLLQEEKYWQAFRRRCVKKVDKNAARCVMEKLC